MLPEYSLLLHIPPPPPPVTLTVNGRGRVYPSKALLTRLRLRAGQPIDLLPPTAECASWQLDLRAEAAHRLRWHENTRPRIEGVRLPAGLVPPGKPLALALGPAAPTTPNCYLLLPLAA